VPDPRKRSVNHSPLGAASASPANSLTSFLGANAQEVKKKFQTTGIVFADATKGKSFREKIFSGTTRHTNVDNNN
jgi:hypothetical protein